MVERAIFRRWRDILEHLAAYPLAKDEAGATVFAQASK